MNLGSIDVFHHLVVDGQTRAQLNEALTLLRGLNQKQETMMGLVEDISAKLDAAATNVEGIATDVTSLKDQIAALVAAGSGATTADLEALLAKATALEGRTSEIDLSTP